MSVCLICGVGSGLEVSLRNWVGARGEEQAYLVRAAEDDWDEEAEVHFLCSGEIGMALGGKCFGDVGQKSFEM